MVSALDLISKRNKELGKGNYSLAQFLEMEEFNEDYKRNKKIRMDG